jgi:hypothetical protein
MYAIIQGTFTQSLPSGRREWLMKMHSLHDLEKLSAFLDGQLSKAEKARLESRLQEDKELVSVLEDLQQTRAILQKTPQHRIPRDFRLTPKMTGVRPPLPTLVPAFSWASAAAMLLFIFTLGVNMLGHLASSSPATLMAAAPMSSGAYGVGGGPTISQTPATDNAQNMSTPEKLAIAPPEATPQPETRQITPSSPSVAKPASQGINFWLILWPGLAVILIAIALLIRWKNMRDFQHQQQEKQNK